jgi:predicted nucleic acid-binding protein
MSGKAFIDTNLLIYAYSDDDIQKISITKRS